MCSDAIGHRLRSDSFPTKVRPISNPSDFRFGESSNSPDPSPTNRSASLEPSRKLRVVLVAGAGRSGSTLLTLMLGSHPDAFAVGELRYLWARGIVERRSCGCGQPVPECPVWSKILDRAFGDLSATEVTRAIDALNWLGDPSNLPKLLRRGERGPFPELHGLRDQLSDLYQSTADVTGATLIVDSSKPPTYGWFVGTLPNIELSVIHLVRDPRGAAFSWLNPKPATDRPSGGLMPRKPPWKSALNWDLWNTATELLFRGRPDRVLRIRYEDLVADPHRTLSSVLEFLGYPEHALASMSGDHFTRGTSHTVAGNPSRLADEPTTLKLDAAWHSDMTPWSRRVVTALSTPLLHHYGYAVRRSHRAEGADRKDPPKPAVARLVSRRRPSTDWLSSRR